MCCYVSSFVSSLRTKDSRELQVDYFPPIALILLAAAVSSVAVNVVSLLRWLSVHYDCHVRSHRFCRRERCRVRNTGWMTSWWGDDLFSITSYGRRGCNCSCCCSWCRCHHHGRRCNSYSGLRCTEQSVLPCLSEASSSSLTSVPGGFCYVVARFPISCLFKAYSFHRVGPLDDIGDVSAP